MNRIQLEFKDYESYCEYLFNLIEADTTKYDNFEEDILKLAREKGKGKYRPLTKEEYDIKFNRVEL